MNRVAKWALFVALSIVFGYAAIMLIGEDSPDSNLSFCDVFIIKAFAFLALYACCKVFKYLYRKSLLPDWLINELKDE